MTQDEGRRKPRHRRRASAVAGPLQPAASPPPVAPAPAAAASPPREPPLPRKQPRPQRRETGERGLRDLVGGGSSQLGISHAMRARDVNRPTVQDLADAAAELQVVRRNWQPPS